MDEAVLTKSESSSASGEPFSVIFDMTDADSNITTGSTPQDYNDTIETTPNKCRLLDTPPELRSKIYAVTFNSNETDDVELTTATPPTGGITLCNKQLRHETLQLSRAAYAAFWTKTHFKLTNSTTTAAHFRNCQARRHLKGIQHLTFHIAATDALRNFYQPNRIIQPRGSVFDSGEWVFQRSGAGKWWLQEPEEGWRVWRLFLCWEDWADADQDVCDGIICLRQTDEEREEEDDGEAGLGLMEVEVEDLLKWGKEAGTRVD